MPRTIQIQDLPAEEIAALLAKSGSTLTREQIVALQEFIDGIGGVENAWTAVDMLSQLEDAA
jgi:hypothetical protein